MSTTTLTSHDVRRPFDGLTGSAGLIERIRSEFEEMPGLVLTVAQASRLWGLSPLQSEWFLNTLVEDGFLVCDRRVAYRRHGCPRCE